MELMTTDSVAIDTRDPQTGVKGATVVLQLIVCDLAGEEYGADIDQVREIVTAGRITPMPASPGFIRGMVNVKGEVVVVIDLKKRFSMREGEHAKNKHIVVTEQNKNVFGLMVDEVTEVLRIPASEVKPPPEAITKIDREYVSGIITLNNRVIVLLDLAKVLSEDQLTKLASTQAEQSTQAQETEDTGLGDPVPSGAGWGSAAQGIRGSEIQ